MPLNRLKLLDSLRLEEVGSSTPKSVVPVAARLHERRFAALETASSVQRQDRQDPASLSETLVSDLQLPARKKHSFFIKIRFNGDFMRLEGVEPPPLTGPDPKSGASASFAIAARGILRENGAPMRNSLNAAAYLNKNGAPSRD